MIEPLQNLDLDHAFICTPDRLEALGALIAAGLNPGPSRVHHGQGTANDCFYFENAYLELLWMTDEAEIRSPIVQPLRLWERIHWRQTGASPFGAAFRPMAGFDPAKLESWPYAAAYLPAGQSIPVLSPRDAADQALVFMPLNPLPPSAYGEPGSAHLIHRGRARRITCVAYPPVSAESGEISGGAKRDTCFRHMILELDGGLGEVSDLRPALPLEIRW